MFKRIYKRVIEKMLSVEVMCGPKEKNIDYSIASRVINVIVRKGRIHADKSY
jgi:hypothetical protein